MRTISRWLFIEVLRRVSDMQLGLTRFHKHIELVCWNSGHARQARNRPSSLNYTQNTSSDSQAKVVFARFVTLEAWTIFAEANNIFLAL